MLVVGQNLIVAEGAGRQYRILTIHEHQRIIARRSNRVRIHCDVVLDKLLDHRIVILCHFTFLCVIAGDEFIGFLSRKLLIGGREDCKYLTTV